MGCTTKYKTVVISVSKGLEESTIQTKGWNPDRVVTCWILLLFASPDSSHQEPFDFHAVAAHLISVPELHHHEALGFHFMWYMLSVV